MKFAQIILPAFLATAIVLVPSSPAWTQTRPIALQGGILFLAFVFLVGSFFRTQVLQHAQYVLQSEENRLREVPLPAPRGVIYSRPVTRVKAGADYRYDVGVVRSIGELKSTIARTLGDRLRPLG